MLKIFIFLSATIAVAYSAWEHTDYCGIESCEGRPHTFWVYRTENPSEACHGPIKTGLTAVEKRKILDLHNSLRQKVARGEEKRGKPGPQPPARYMRELEWDDELGDLAQRWANQCVFAPDQCRDVERFEVGQLLYQYRVKDDIMKIDVEELVKRWYNHVEQVDANAISNYNYEFRDKQRFYTQMVWADTHKIGCGAMRYPTSYPDRNRFMLVCNYGPTGNIKGQPVYKTF